MNDEATTGPIAIFAGGGALPSLVSSAAQAGGQETIIFAIAGEADAASFAGSPVHMLRWGQIGRMFRLAKNAGCRRAIFIGTVARRPNFRAILPDIGTLKLLPRILRLMRGGDDGLLSGVAAIFKERGISLVSPLDIAPGLSLEPGCRVGKPRRHSGSDFAAAHRAAREIGRRDIAQAAVAAGEIVAVEDAAGTDALLVRVAVMRGEGRIGRAGGILVKCMKPQQDPRLDVPTIGPETARLAARAGLDGVAAEAGRTLLAGRAATLEAFQEAGLFLYGFTATDFPRDG